MTSPRLVDSRPQLVPYAPVLPRGPAEWQIGLDPAHAVVLSGPAYAELLRLLDGRRPMELVRQLARAGGLTAREVDRTLSTLRSAGLLVDAGGPTGIAPPASRIRLIGAGALGRAAAEQLAASGVAALHVFDDEPPEAGLYPTAGALGTRSAALCAELGGRTTTSLHPLTHWTKPDAAPVDLTIVAGEGPEVDRLLSDHFLRLDQPHLLLRNLGRSVVVGPLVIPGATSCLRCADLTRRDADPAWPAVLAQLSRVVVPTVAPLVSWAGSLAAVQALAFLNGSVPETAGATLETGIDDFTMRLRAWPAHPGCGCSWSATTQWDP